MVAIPRLPVKKEELVDVAIRLPTVSCVPVAIIFPDAFETKIEEAGYELPALLLKVVQSVDERQPVAEPLETVQSITNAPPIAERPAVTVTPPEAETVPVAIPAKSPFVPTVRI